MKTNISILTVVALAGVLACQRPEFRQPAVQEVTFHACQGDETKTQLKDDGSILWSPGDAIRLFFGSSASSRFETSIGSPAGEADFTGDASGLEDMPAGSSVWAVYPYAEGQRFDESSVTLTLPARQQAVAGTFDKDLFISMARSTGFNLTFYNLCGGVKFSVNRSGIKTVHFKGNAGETLAGTLQAGFDSSGKPKVQAVSDRVSEIVVDAPAGGFIPGKWYYIVTLPATLSKGYTLSFEGDKPMGSRVSDKQVTIRRAVWGVLEEADGIRVSKDAFSFKSVGGSATLTVIAGGEWTASSDASWCTVTPASGSGKADVTLQVAQNEAEASRSASIVFEMADHSQRRTVNVTQDGYHTLPEGIDWSRPFHHKSLVMKFTATWCGYCPIMAQAVDLAMEQHPGKLEAVNIHGGGSDYVFSNYSALTSLYSISGYPSGIVDGRREIQNYAYTTTASNIGKYMAETEDNYPVSSAIGLSSTLSGRKLSLDLQLFIKDEASYKVTVMLLENGIIGYQEDYNEGNHQDYRHDHVARMALTNVLGDSFSTSYDFERKDLRYSADIPSSYNLENMTVLVYVQRAYGSLPVVGTNYGGYFVDNAISAPVDTTVEPAVD